MEDFHHRNNDSVPKGKWCDAQYDVLRASIVRLFPGLMLDGPGNPLENGTFFFDKGQSRGFKYVNLSSGEKAAFDLILDLFISARAYEDAIYCIDEPEAHMNTRLHGALLDELLRLIPESGQLWIATYSVGVIRRAIQIGAENPGTVVFLDFHDSDFDLETELRPADVSPAFWARNLHTTLADLADLVAPGTIVLCEGARSVDGARRAEFDAYCLQKMFGKEFPDTLFISVGSSTDILTGGAMLKAIIKRIAEGINVITLLDRDERTDGEIERARKNGVKVLMRRQLECYLLDDEVLSALLQDHECSGVVPDILAQKQKEVDRARRARTCI